MKIKSLLLPVIMLLNFVCVYADDTAQEPAFAPIPKACWENYRDKVGDSLGSSIIQRISRQEIIDGKMPHHEAGQTTEHHGMLEYVVLERLQAWAAYLATGAGAEPSKSVNYTAAFPNSGAFKSLLRIFDRSDDLTLRSIVASKAATDDSLTLYTVTLTFPFDEPLEPISMCLISSPSQAYPNITALVKAMSQNKEMHRICLEHLFPPSKVGA